MADRWRVPLLVALILLGLIMFVLFVSVWSPCGFCSPNGMPSPPLDLQVAPFFRIFGIALVGVGVGGLFAAHRQRKGLPSWG